MHVPSVRPASKGRLSLVSVLALVAATPGLGAQEPESPEIIEGDVILLDEFVITGVARPGTTRLRSSVSLSAFDPGQVAPAAPRFAAEIFRSLPGIRSEATAGDGNTNITVRGAPISAGGSRYLQIQEDGLPLLQFGDIAFATSDSFLRVDNLVQGIQTIRGGSASTFASNSPGGIINILSKTGETEGGSLSWTTGLDFESDRIDLDAGGSLGESMQYHVGGFWRTGEGTRTTGFNPGGGHQFRGNWTRRFDKGYVRVHLKRLDDRTPTYLPMPIAVSGSNASPSFGSVRGFDHRTATLYSPYLRRDLVIDGDGNRLASDVADGLAVETTALGVEASFELADGWTITNRFRHASNSGQFLSPFPAEVTSASALATSIGGAGATLVYANGPSRGQAIANPGALNGNGLLARIHLFNTKLNDFDLTANDLRVSRIFDFGDDGRLDVTGGIYLSRQAVNMDWLWNTYLQEVRENGALVDVRAAGGSLVTEGGLVAYGTPAWGNLRRRYDVDYDTAAPFLSLSHEKGPWNFEASVRSDRNDAGGSYAGGVTRANLDVNQDGVISGPERSVEVVNTNNPNPVAYGVGFTSWSAGVNYAFDRSLGVFARYSEGASASADRILFGSSVRADGSIVGDQASYNELAQFELGVKYQTQTLLPGQLALLGTFFHAETTESNYELTSQRFTNRVYVANGLELEALYTHGGFDLRAGATLTNAEIDAAESAALVGKTPRRQADLVWQVTPSWRVGRFQFGGSLIGTTDSYAQDDNQMVLPSYAYLNAFASVQIASGLSLSIAANNVTDEFGLSESEEGSVPASGVVRARGITGRTISATLTYSF